MYRRRFLTISAPGVVGSIAGCSSRTDQPSGLVLETLELENQTNRSAVFDVEILNEAETKVFETKQRVSDDAAVALDQPVDGPGQYTLDVATDEQSLTQDLSSFAEKGESCVIVLVRLDQGERLRLEGNGYTDCTD